MKKGEALEEWRNNISRGRNEKKTEKGAIKGHADPP